MTDKTTPETDPKVEALESQLAAERAKREHLENERGEFVNMLHECADLFEERGQHGLAKQYRPKSDQQSSPAQPVEYCQQFRDPDGRYDEICGKPMPCRAHDSWPGALRSQPTPTGETDCPEDQCVNCEAHLSECRARLMRGGLVCCKSCSHGKPTPTGEKEYKTCGCWPPPSMRNGEHHEECEFHVTKPSPVATAAEVERAPWVPNVHDVVRVSGMRLRNGSRGTVLGYNSAGDGLWSLHMHEDGQTVRYALSELEPADPSPTAEEADCSQPSCGMTARIEGLCVAHFKQKEGERALFSVTSDIEARGGKTAEEAPLTRTELVKALLNADRWSNCSGFRRVADELAKAPK